jgi:hypothetical protein
MLMLIALLQNLPYLLPPLLMQLDIFLELKPALSLLASVTVSLLAQERPHSMDLLKVREL